MKTTTYSPDSTTSVTKSLTTNDIQGIHEAVIYEYFARLNNGEFTVTAELFAKQGCLNPPFDKLDSVTISGKGVVMKQDLRMETIEVSIGKVGINPLRAVFGNIELIHPTDAEALIVLTAIDLNRAFRSDYIQAKLRGLKMIMNGQEISVTIQQVIINLPGDNKFVITIDFLLAEQTEVKKLSATAVPKIQEDGHRISLEILAIEGQGLSLDLVSVIVEQLTALLDMRNFIIPGLSLQLYKLEAPEGKLVIHSHAQVAQVTPIINLI